MLLSFEEAAKVSPKKHYLSLLVIALDSIGRGDCKEIEKNLQPHTCSLFLVYICVLSRLIFELGEFRCYAFTT